MIPMNATVCSDAAKSKNISLYVRSTVKVIYGQERLRKKEKPDSVLRMCESGNAVASKVVVDTYDSALYGVGSCRCDIAFIATGIAQLTYDRVDWLHPGVANCGSEVIFNIDGALIVMPCTLYKSSQLQVAQNTLSYLTWESKRQNSRSGYCVLFELTPDAAKLNMTCIATTRSTSEIITTLENTTPPDTTSETTTTAVQVSDRKTTASVTLESTTASQPIKEATVKTLALISTDSSDIATPKSEGNSTCRCFTDVISSDETVLRGTIIVCATVIVCVLILTCGFVVVYIYRRKVNKRSICEKKEDTEVNLDVKHVYENTSYRREETPGDRERVMAGQEGFTGSQYMQLNMRTM